LWIERKFGLYHHKYGTGKRVSNRKKTDISSQFGLHLYKRLGFVKTGCLA